MQILLNCKQSSMNALDHKINHGIIAHWKILLNCKSLSVLIWFKGCTGSYIMECNNCSLEILLNCKQALICWVQRMHWVINHGMQQLLTGRFCSTVNQVQRMHWVINHGMQQLLTGRFCSTVNQVQRMHWVINHGMQQLLTGRFCSTVNQVQRMHWVINHGMQQLLTSWLTGRFCSTVNKPWSVRFERCTGS